MAARSDQVQQRCYGEWEYRLIRSRRRSIEIRITDEAQIEVRVPRRTTFKEIHAFLDEKRSWIERHRQRARALVGPFFNQGYKDGARFLFMGEWRRLSVQPDMVRQPTICLEREALIARTPLAKDPATDSSELRAALRRWYRQQAKEYLGVKVFHWARRMGVAPECVSVKEQKHLWGSCAVHRRAVHLNWRLIMAPPSVMDAVIVHELCHLWVPDHSSRFWRLVFHYFPNYKKEDQWLRRHRTVMRLP